MVNGHHKGRGLGLADCVPAKQRNLASKCRIGRSEARRLFVGAVAALQFLM
jgi:hypothetical protein